MATVYLARDVKHGRQVAVKVLRPELVASLGTERFLREIAIAARLHHPHILPLYDSGEAYGPDQSGPLLYYVMPYVDGESLRDRLDREKQLPLDDALRIAHEVADALSYAHSHDVVHRDIKPGNILFEAGHAVVTDFGIALAVSAAGKERVTEPGAYVGTPEYMSPEQATGEQELDGRSDVYSLACVLYEMLAGQPPFVGPNARAVIARHITDPVPPLATVRPNVGAGLEWVVTKALAKVPADRFSTASEFVDALATRGVDRGTSTARSIAVLAFANMSADPENEYLSDGISEEIINALAKIEGVRVASRTSAFSFKGKAEDIRTIGERLNVSTVLEGSVRRAGDRLRIVAQLVNVADGYHLWSERYDREMEDVFAIQDEIAQNIAGVLRVILSEDERRAIQKVPTADVEAYDYYLRGRQYFHQFRNRSLLYARQMFSRAIEVDSDYALAHAGVADCCSVMYMYFEASEANLEHADAASLKALALDPDLAEAHTARGLAVSLSKRHDEAAREFETAIRLNPKLFEAHYFYARACFQQGKLEQALQLFQQACQVREDYQAGLLLATTYAAMDRKKEAEAAYRRALQVAERHLELNPDDARALTMGAVALGRAGQRARSLDWAERALAIEPEDAVVLYAVACLYGVLEETDKAIACLGEAIEHGFGNRKWMEHDPDLDSLRGDPRFEALLQRA